MIESLSNTGVQMLFVELYRY